MAAPEEELKKLARLPENKQCANCDNNSQFGHGNVCMPFKIFVCSNCKSAFQAFSFRVKSITMSNFTKEEVDSFRSRFGGGNDIARRTFQANLAFEDPMRPRTGDSPDKYKAFVQRVYMDKAFYNPDATSGTGAARPVAKTVAPEAPAGWSVGGGEISGVKGRWGPSAPAAKPSAPTTDSLGRKVDSGWGDQSNEGPSDGSDGIKIRTEAPQGAAPAEEVDLLGFATGSTATNPPPPIAAASSKSSGVDDLFSFGTMTGPAVSPAVPAPSLSATIMGAYQQSPNTPSTGMSGGLSGGAAISHAFGPGPGAGPRPPMPGYPGVPLPAYSGGYSPAPQFGGSPQVGGSGMNAISNIMMHMAPAPGPAMGLNAILAPAPAPRQTSAASTATGSGTPQSGGGLDGLLAGLGIADGRADFSMAAATPKTPAITPSAVPLGRSVSSGPASSPGVMGGGGVMAGGFNPGAAAISSLGGMAPQMGGPSGYPGAPRPAGFPYGGMPGGFGGPGGPGAMPTAPGMGFPGGFGAPMPGAYPSGGPPPGSFPAPVAQGGPRSFDPFFGI